MSETGFGLGGKMDSLTDVMKDAARWVSQITGMAAGYVLDELTDGNIISNTENEIFGKHPLCANLCLRSWCTRCECEKDLIAAGEAAMCNRTAGYYDSILGEHTIYACPVIFKPTLGSEVVGVLCAYLHGSSALRLPEDLATRFKISREKAYNAIESTMSDALSPIKQEVTQTTITALCAKLARIVNADVQASEISVDNSENSTNQVLNTLLNSLGEWQSVPDVLQRLAVFLSSVLGFERVRVWMVNRQENLTATGAVDGYFKMIISSDTASPEISELIAFQDLPVGIFDYKETIIISGQDARDLPGFGAWITHSQASDDGAICFVNLDGHLAGALGVSRSQPLDHDTLVMFNSIGRHASIALTAARQVERVHRDLDRLQQLGLMLATNNARLREADQARHILLTSMNHELRTPLNAIVGFTELLRDGVMGKLNPHQALYLENIETCGRHLEKLINDMLEVADLETGRYIIRPEPCAVAPIVMEVLQTIGPMAVSSDIKIEAQSPPDDAFIVTDATWLRQIILNLLSNAIKSSPAKSVIKLQIEVSPTGVKVKVQDASEGIPLVEQHQIFEQFQRGSGEVHNNSAGSCLALPLVRRLTETQGGAVEVHNPPEGGACISVFIPSAVKLPDISPPEAPQEIVVISGNKDHDLICIFEHDPANRKVINDFVLSAGYRTLAFDIADDIFDIVVKEHPKAVIYGQSLGLNRLDAQFLKLLSNEETHGIPTIFIGDRRLQDKAMGLGVSATLNYPIQQTKLVHLLHKIITPLREGALLGLIIDDNPNFAEAMRVIFSTIGFHALIARDGAEGIEMARRYRPDIILLDYIMPRTPGPVVLEKLRSYEETKNIPVIFMTIKPLTIEEKERLESQVTALISKPDFSPAALWSIIDKLGLGSAQGLVN